MLELIHKTANVVHLSSYTWPYLRDIITLSDHNKPSTTDNRHHILITYMPYFADMVQLITPQYVIYMSNMLYHTASKAHMLEQLLKYQQPIAIIRIRCKSLNKRDLHGYRNTQAVKDWFEDGLNYKRVSMGLLFTDIGLGVR